MPQGGRVTPYNNLMREVQNNTTNNTSNVRVVVENHGGGEASVTEQQMNDERVIRVVVGNINARKQIHKAITSTTSATNKVGV